MRWPAFLRRPYRAVTVPQGLARFDTASLAELDELPRRFRNAIVADRKRRVTAALERFVAAGGVEPLPPRTEIVTRVREGRA